MFNIYGFKITSSESYENLLRSLNGTELSLGQKLVSIGFHVCRSTYKQAEDFQNYTYYYWGQKGRMVSPEDIQDYT